MSVSNYIDNLENGNGPLPALLSRTLEFLREKYSYNVYAIRDGGYWIGRLNDYSNEDEEAPDDWLIEAVDEEYEDAMKHFVLLVLKNIDNIYNTFGKLSK